MGSRSSVLTRVLRLTMAAEIALAHHERWDGGGYPNRLAGEGIPLSARIMNLADQYDALRNARVYMPAYDHAPPPAASSSMVTTGPCQAISIPGLLEVFKENNDEFAATYERFKD